jgi:hypothetical protein
VKWLKQTNSFFSFSNFSIAQYGLAKIRFYENPDLAGFLTWLFLFQPRACMALSDSGPKTTREIDDDTNQQQQAERAAANHRAAKIKAAAAEQE